MYTSIIGHWQNWLINRTSVPWLASGAGWSVHHSSAKHVNSTYLLMPLSLVHNIARPQKSVRSS